MGNAQKATIPEAWGGGATLRPTKQNLSVKTMDRGEKADRGFLGQIAEGRPDLLLFLLRPRQQEPKRTRPRVGVEETGLKIIRRSRNPR